MSGPDDLSLAATDAAAEWLVLRDRGLSPAEKDRFAHWLSADKAHARAWSLAESAWATFDEPANPDLEEMRRAALRARRPQPSYWMQGAAAAAIVLTAAAAGFVGLRIWSPAGRDVQTSRALASETFEARDAVRTLKLPDGGGLTLDAGAVVEVAFTATRRDVRLRRGRAYFEVAPDAARPFAVVAAGRTVTDVGTAFQIETRDRNMSVMLQRGAVSIAQPDGSTVRLAPGERFQATGDASGVVERVNVAKALEWREAWVEFRDTPLATALQHISGENGGAVRVGDAAAAKVRVSGRFHTGDAERFARALVEIYPLKLVRRGGVLTLLGR